MKKFLSVVIAAMITMACTVFPTFATTADTATPDTAVEVESIEITKLPDKLVYVGGEDVDWDYDSVSLGDIMNGDLEAAEALKAMELKFNLDLTGIEVVATYTDSTTANVPVEELSAKVTNTLTYGEILVISIKYEDMLEDENLEFEEYDKILEEYDNEIMATILRDYIVEVDYKGATDTYIVNILDDFNDFNDSSDYELVSYTAPNKTVYDMANEDEVIIEDWSDEEYGEYFYYDIDFVTEGLTATICNKNTGEVLTITEEDIDVMPFSLTYDYDESGKLKPGVYMIQATAYTPDYDYVDFEFPITIIDSTIVDSSTTSTTPVEDDADKDTDKDADKNNATATPDSDNTAIKTGSASSVTTVLSVVLVMTAGIVLFWYKKRVTE